ncbi:MAG: PD40 domain-containing protein [Anaerolineae bacterium]|nr:PD40 domain-containing protein [Anaerolineae bacterium]
MYRILALLLTLSVILIGCSAEPTPTLEPTAQPTEIPTQAPTDTPEPTATQVPTVASTDTPSPTSTPTPVTGVVKSTLNVRQEPTTRATLLGVLTKDDVVTLVGRTEDSSWLQINYPLGESTTAWVIAERIDTTANLAALPVISATAATTATAVTTSVAAITSTAGTRATPTPDTGTVTATSAATATVQATVETTTTVTVEATVVPPTGGTPPGSILFDSYENGIFNVYRVRADGTGLQQVIPNASDPALSPDGSRIAYRMRRDIGGLGIALATAGGDFLSTVTEESAAGYPSWSPDGNNLAYNVVSSNARIPAQILRIAVGPDNSPVTVGDGWRPAWQPSPGTNILFDGCKGATDCGSLLNLNAFEGDPTNPTLITFGQGGAWSPNGSQIAFQAPDDKGLSQIWIANADGSGRTLVTTDVVTHGMPIWSSDGQWLFYRSDQGGVGWAIFAIRTNGTDARKIIDSNVHPDQWVYAKLAIAP